MRVAFYSTFLLEYGGGLEKYLIETASHLARQKDITADVITMDDAFMSKLTDMQSIFYMRKIDKQINYKEDIANIKKQLSPAQYHKMANFRALRSKLQEYDVIYCKNELIESFILKFFVGYQNIPPVVFGGHTPLYYPQPQSFHARLHNFLYAGKMYQFLASGVQRFHAINSFEEDRYQRLFPGKTVHKIYNPFDIKKFRARASEHEFADFQDDAAAINILWIGRLTEQKGVRDLVKVIDAVNVTLDNPGKVRWHIFGDGELRPLIDELRDRHDNVRYYGHVDQKYMPSIYQKSQVVLSTSHWEGYPYSLIEPQAFGLQGFAFNIPGPSDIFSAYDGGTIVQDVPEMVQKITDLVQTHKQKAAIPVSQASDQFEPTLIYGKLTELLQMGKT